jgi:CheY-like chemotaxis protein
MITISNIKPSNTRIVMKKASPYESGSTLLYDDTKNARILLAEDDEGNGLQIREYLYSLGYMTDWSCNGLQALEYAMEKEYDLFLIDVSMPRMGGMELIQKLRNENKYTKTPVLLITGSISLESQKGLPHTYIQSFIYKPFTLEHLALQVKRFLNIPQPQ